MHADTALGAEEMAGDKRDLVLVSVWMLHLDKVEQQI